MNEGRARVLIVDDNADDLAMYSRWLLACNERRLTVITASSPAAALESFAAYKPDCIVLDYNLRDSTGLDFMAELHKRGFEAPIIAITGSGTEAIAVEFMKAGARDYLTKSQMSANDLCSAVVAHLSPYAMRHQLALYREREQSINATLSAVLERVSFLAETGKLFAATLDFHEVLTLAVTRALPFLGEACVIDLLEGDTLRRRAVHLDGPASLNAARDELAASAPGPDVFTGAMRALRDVTPLFVSGDALARAARDDADLAVLTGVGLAGAAFLPLRFAGVPIGILTLGTVRPGAVSDVERLLLDDYAQRVAVAIGNARIVEAERLARDRAEAAKRRLTFQSRISTLFARSLDWETTLQKLMTLVTTSFSDSAAIFSVEEPQRTIRFVAAAAHTKALQKTIAQYYTDFPPLLSDHVGTGRAVRTGRSQFFSKEPIAYSRDPLTSRRQRELIAAWAPVSDISVPLQMRGTVVGAIMLVRDVSKRPFAIEDVAVAEDVARRTSIYMEIARLYQSEHGIASALQQALLPAELPAVSDLLFGVRYFAGADGMDVGGDWYDIVEIDSGHIVITVGDVIGRGVEAAAAMGQYRDILRAYAFERFGPAKALTRLNDLVNALRGEAFATCMIIVLDRKTRRIDYASAGHPPAMLRLADGLVRVLDGARSMPIGAWAHTDYVEDSTDMPVGSTLVLYTDGLVETRHRSAAEGVDVLHAALNRSGNDIEVMLDGLLRDVAPDRSDDIAILAVTMLPPQSETLHRWVFGRIDRSIMTTIRGEFDALLAARAAPDSDIHGARLILGELLSNLVRHAPGSFRLELDWSAPYAELRLFDNGPGFAPGEFAVPQDILSMTGRGLFIISALGRSFSVAGRPGGGSATSVVLPVRDRSEDLELAVH